MDQQPIQQIQHITYSTKYSDDTYEYRHVVLPSQLTDIVPRHLLAEHEWRSLGLQQSRGWIHYGFYGPEKNVLLFRRKLPPPAERPVAPAPVLVDSEAGDT
ncbi:hypothetical protein AAMO2058_000974400 [Amorphochlora amoebiformis]|eukprot:296569-Amorphochlora_amoeboformis.AAC.1